MSTTKKFIVLPYLKNRGNLVPGEMRQASNEVSAEKIAAVTGRKSRRAVGAGCDEAHGKPLEQDRARCIPE
ncbi:hypothetical protein PH562_03575 [Rhizobium sp. CNPSo 4062]|uniref:hypothetical protein n=1 Tax=Rhizobium sp. CNPSo 4062 TaxID=3021410 RepID=UPI00254BE45A|nr:hypothetical protein [Rhizobium sp. CNPSo 4062]MDK4701303.1 hypothetical protein [Rhizobium sp. CNPSo 4062]